MSNISSTDARSVKLMRWVARFLSIPWAFLTLCVTMFGVLSAVGEGDISIVTFIFIMFALMSVGGALIASVWGKEALGGGLLIAAGVLRLGQNIYDFFIYNPEELQPDWFNVAMILLPLVAGSLFLVCHRRSKMSGEQRV